MSEAQSLDFGQLRVVGKGRQHASQSVQGVVEVVHSVPLAVVGLHPAVLLHDVHGGFVPRAPPAPLLLLQLGWRRRWLAAGGRGGRGVEAAARVLVISVRKGVVAA